MTSRKEKLEREAQECSVKLDRAVKLTSGLSGEKVRWSNDIQIFQAKEDLIAGNSVIGAGMVAYSGPFTSNYR
jgi:dynein heavy chain